MIPYDLSTPTTSAGLRLRRSLLPIVLLAFGISTTVFLIGMWGHTTSGDSDTLAESARTVLGADEVADSVNDWLSDGIATVAELPAGALRSTVAEVQTSPQAETAIDHLVDETIAALLAPAASRPSVDVGEALAPLVPMVVAELGERGIDVPEGRIAEAIADLEPISLAIEEVEPATSIVRQTRALLSRVLIIAIGAMSITGILALALSEDRLTMVRSLAVRVAASGFSFVVIFNVAAWALDPERGRSPVLGAGGVVLGSNLHVFFVVALPAAMIFAVTALVLWRRAKTVSAAGGSTAEPTTQELAPV